MVASSEASYPPNPISSTRIPAGHQPARATPAWMCAADTVEIIRLVLSFLGHGVVDEAWTCARLALWYVGSRARPSGRTRLRDRHDRSGWLRSDRSSVHRIVPVGDEPGSATSRGHGERAGVDAGGVLR